MHLDGSFVHGCSSALSRSISYKPCKKTRPICEIAETERYNVATFTFEGKVENGQIRLPDDVRLPENTKVYVVLSESGNAKHVRVHSPRLKYPAQSADFAKQIVEVRPNAEL
jgi:hypothetical protein